MRRFFITAAAVCLSAAAASAQTKISATAQCGAPDPQHMIPVGDKADHSMGVAQFKCTYTKPWEIAGDKPKEGVNTETIDTIGNTSRARGVHVATTEGGDKFFVSYQGMATSNGTAFTGAKGNWGFSGGTGKLKGIKGKGTYTCAPANDALSCEIEGEYQIGK